jgi:hypothetical protein
MQGIQLALDRVVLPASQCESFLAYIRDLSDAALLEEHFNYTWLCNRNDPSEGAARWKAAKCLAELELRHASNQAF